MWNNYFRIAFRNIVGQRMYSAINIGGLALGIAAFVLILQYVGLEQSVNGFHKQLPQIHRVLCQSPDGKSWPEVEPGWAAKFKETYPEVQGYCRIADGIGQGIVKNESNNISFREEGVCYGEGNFFTFFTFPLLQGDASAMLRPDVVFISNVAATKYFGNENPMGKALVLYNQFGNHRYIVEGVYEAMKDNSDIQYDMVFSLETLKNEANLGDNGWAKMDNLDSQFSNMFLLLDKHADVAILEQKANDLRRKIQPEKDAVEFRFQPFSQTHLAASFSDNLYHTGNVRYVYLLTIIGLLILVIAWFNYVNLSTASALRRGKEVGVRKAIGASKGTLVAQFLSEALLVNVLGIALAGLLVIALQPLFNEIIGKKLALSNLFTTKVWLWGLVTLLLGSLLSGVFAANLITKFNPAETLRGRVTQAVGGLKLRQVLVVAQFVISTALILFTVVIYSQLKYLQNKELGINTAQLMVIKGPEIGRDSTFKNRKSAFLDELAAQSFVQDYCASGCVPGKGYNFATAGFSSPKSKPSDMENSYNFAIVDERFVETYGIGLAVGRNFSAAECKVEWNENSKIMVNEMALAALGLTTDEALTTRIKWDERELDIVGVVKDYHHTSLQKPIEPILYYPQSNSAFITVRLAPNGLSDKIKTVDKLYAQHFSGNPFEYFFTDESFQKAYVSEQQYSSLFTSASIWAVFIACLGLYGLVFFTIQTRVKEIGIRKVLGANVAGITGLLAKDFVKLVLIAIVIASPIAYYFMNKWLADFAYRIDIQWWMFAVAGALAVGIAFLTVGAQSVKAALANPVKSLRSE